MRAVDKPNQATAQQSDLARTKLDADAAAAAILEHDRIAPGYAVAVVRNIIKQLPVDDALALIGQPKLKPKLPIDAAALIG